MNDSVVSNLPGVLGHELRNPLASAVTALSLLGEMVDRDDPRRSMVNRALVDLDRITNLIDGWLTVSRSGATAKAAVDIDELLDAAARTHDAIVVSERVGVAVEGDRALLGRALDNLLENARQAGARKLRIAAQSLRGEVSIHVEDDGVGISEGDISSIFTPGWSGRGGHGLGLHAVVATLRAHGGRIHCVRLSRGTRFTLRLPTERSQTAAFS